VTDTEAVLALIAAWVLTTDADAVAVFAEQDATTLWGAIEKAVMDPETVDLTL